ncbi:metal ABC transporter permease [Leucobacter sp. HY1908]
MEFFESVFVYAYLQRALTTSLVVGVVCGIVGTLTLLRGASLIGDAISHAVLPGIAASAALGFGFFPGALIAGLLTATGISYFSSQTRIRNDAVIGIVFTAMFSLGIVLISLKPSSTDLTKILFGNVLAIGRSDMLVTISVAVLVLLAVALLYQELLITTFDPVIAATYGISPVVMHYTLMALLTLVTVASLQAVGVILVVALLITPAATAFLIARSVSRMMIIAAGFGAFASLTGLIASFYLNVPSGPAIVLASATIFVVVFAVQKCSQRRTKASAAPLRTSPDHSLPERETV